MTTITKVDCFLPETRNEAVGFPITYKSLGTEVSIQLESILHKDGFVTICNAEDLTDKKHCLVAKVVQFEKDGNKWEYDFRIDSIKKEARLLELLRPVQVGIVRSPGILFSDEVRGHQRIFLLLEKYNNNLEDLLPSLSLDLRFLCFDQIIKGLNYMHKKGIDHGDISLSNCLLRGQHKPEVVLTDFECSFHEEDLPNTWAIGDYYPGNECDFSKSLVKECQVANGESYKEKLRQVHEHRKAQDIYALGILATFIFYDKDVKDRVCTPLKDLIDQMCVTDWKRRLTIKSVLESWSKIYPKSV